MILHSKEVHCRYPNGGNLNTHIRIRLNVTANTIIVGRMFKKKKDKKRDEAAKNAKNLAKKSDMPTLAQEFTDSLDDTDGFDENGFVDLQPIEGDATLLGPRQKCKYIGTFAVITGVDGQKTLKTHQERTSYVKYHLSDYRNKTHGLDVVLQTSSDGIKVFSSDAKRVRMAYPLQRITFATCDPDFKLYAFMTNSPSPSGVAVHCHVFKGRSTTQVQELTAMIGRAFKLAFASAKLQKNPRYNTGDLVSSPHKPARRWAKHEAIRGHDLSEHAEQAKDKRKELKAKRSNSPTTETDSSPVLEKKRGKAGWRGSSPRSGTPPSQGKFKEISERMSSMSISSSSTVSENSYTMENNETRIIVSETHISKEIESQTSSVESPSLPYSPHKRLTPSAPPLPQSGGVLSSSSSPPGPPLPPRSYKNERPMTQYLMDVPDPQTDVVAVAAVIDDVSGTSEDQDGETKTSNNDIPNQGVKVIYQGAENGTTNEEIESADRLTTHQDAYWYMPGIPREFIMDMLQTSEEGSFFVRNSQSRKGCHALTVRVPTDVQPAGYGNFLITPEPEGVKLEGFTKVFPNITSLVEHYSQHADGLPCKLLLAGSDIQDENDEEEDYCDFDPVDPDYRLLSDFHSIMDELKE